MSLTTEIQTERLNLLALRPDQLRLILDDPGRLEQELGLPISRANDSQPVRRAIGLKLDKMSGLATERHPWYTYWLVVVKAGPYGAGMAGFKGEPDQDGTVEIGYGIDPGYRNQGYTTEAARALIAWAFAHPACRAVIAPGTQKDNPASNRVLAKLDMHVYAETGETLSWRIEKLSPT
jgi:RimJ/RimL family protein N-acetyltransferase